MNIIDELKNRKLFTQVIDTKEVIDAIGGGSGSGSGGGDLPSNAGMGQLMTAYNFCDTDLFESHDVEATTIYNNFVFDVPEDRESGSGSGGGDRSGGDTILRSGDSDYSFDPDHFEPVVLPMPTDLKITKNIISFRNNGKSYAFDLVDLNKKVTSGQINNKALVAAVDRHFAEAGEFDNWYNPFDAGNYNEDTGNIEPKWPIVDTDTNYYEDILKNYLKGAYPASAKAAHYFGTVGDDEGNYNPEIKRYYFDLGALGIEDHYSRVYNYDFDRIFMDDAGTYYRLDCVWPCWSVTDYTFGHPQFVIDSFTNYSPVDPLTVAPYSLKAYSENIKGHFDWPWLLLDYLAKNEGATYQDVTGSSIYDDQAEEWFEESGLVLIGQKLSDLGNYLGWPIPSPTGDVIMGMYVDSLTQYYANRQNFSIAPGTSGVDLFTNGETWLDYGSTPGNCYWEDTGDVSGNGVNYYYEYPFITDIIDPRDSSLTHFYEDWNKIYYNAGSEDGETWAKAHMLDIFNPDNPNYLAGVSTTAKPFWKSSPKKGDVVNYGIALYKFGEGDPTPGTVPPTPRENLNIYYKALYYVDVLKVDMFPWGLDLGDSDTDNVTVKAVETVIDIEKLEDMMNNQE